MKIKKKIAKDSKFAVTENNYQEIEINPMASQYFEADLCSTTFAYNSYCCVQSAYNKNCIVYNLLTTVTYDKKKSCSKLYSGFTGNNPCCKRGINRLHATVVVHKSAFTMFLIQSSY